MRAVKEGRRVSKQSTARAFGIGSSWQVWRADFKMKLLDNTDSETGRKVQSRGRHPMDLPQAKIWSIRTEIQVHVNCL